jgi:hypothetical protein
MSSMVSGKTGPCSLTACVALRLSKTSPWFSASENGVDFLAAQILERFGFDFYYRYRYHQEIINQSDVFDISD